MKSRIVKWLLVRVVDVVETVLDIVEERKLSPAEREERLRGRARKAYDRERR